MQSTFYRATALALAVSLALTSLGGCAVATQNKRDIAQDEAKAKEVFEAHANARPQPVAALEVVSRPYIAAAKPVAVEVSDMPSLPASLADRQVTLATGARQTLPEVVSLMAGELGLPIRMDATLAEESGKPSGGGAQDGGQAVAVNFSGRLADLLGLVTTRFGVYWSYQGGAIVVSRYQTRIYHLPQAFSGTTDVSGSIGGSASGAGGSAAGGSSGSTLDSTVQNQMSVKSSDSVWKSLEASVKSVVDKAGSVTAAPELGLLVVRTTPERLMQIDDLVRSTREVLQHKVLLRMRVYSVSLSREDNVNVSVSALLSSVLDSHGITTTLGGGGSSVTGAGSIGFSVLNNHGNPSTAVVQALSTLGNVSTVYDNPLVTQNGQAVPISNVVSQGYAASTQTTVTPNVGSTTSITPGTVSYGYSMTVLPRIIDKGEIALQVQLNVSNLLKMQTFGASGSQIQLPTIQSEPFIERTMVKTGQTVMLMGLQQVALSNSANGTGDPAFWALGGGSDASRQRQLLVVLVTPEILE